MVLQFFILHIPATSFTLFDCNILSVNIVTVRSFPTLLTTHVHYPVLYYKSLNLLIHLSKV